MVRLVLIDLDGTLVGRGGEILPEVLDALAEARCCGIHLGLCTGRPDAGDARRHARSVSPDGFHIFHNGASVTRIPAEGATTEDADAHRTAMSPASVDALITAARTHGLPLELYLPGAVYGEPRDPLLLEHARQIGIVTAYTDLRAVHGPVLKAQWVVRDEQAPLVERLTAAVPEVELGTGAHADMPGVLFASVTRRGVSKLEAARWLAGRYGLADGLAQVAMVGDGDGDMEVITHAGVGIAMGNATERVRAVARYVVPTVEEAGLAHALRLVMKG